MLPGIWNCSNVAFTWQKRVSSRASSNPLPMMSGENSTVAPSSVTCSDSTLVPAGIAEVSTCPASPGEGGVASAATAEAASVISGRM